MKKRLFVSYSRNDSKLVDEFVENSSNFNFEVWIDKRDQEYGKKWRDSIVEAIKSSDGAILFVTQDSLNSKAVKELEIPEFLNQKDTRGEDFLLYIVILDYVPENTLREFQTINNEFIFKERHIKNVGANKLDSEELLPSEMLEGARQKYWFRLCSEIYNDLISSGNKQIVKKFIINKKFKNFIKRSSILSLLISLMFLGYTGFTSVNERFNNAIENITKAVEELESVPEASDSTNESNMIIQSEDSTTTTAAPTTTAIKNSNENIKVGEAYQINLLRQDMSFLDNLFLEWVEQAKVFSITQYKKGVVLSFTPLYDLNAYKINLNGKNIGSTNFRGSWYHHYNNLVLKNLTDSEFYSLEIYLVDRYYREFGPINFDFQYVWNNDDPFRYDDIEYTDFDGILVGDFSNNPNRHVIPNTPTLKSNLNAVEVNTYYEISNLYKYRIVIDNLIYEQFTHYLVVYKDEIIYLSNILDFYVTEEMFDEYIKIIPFNNILSYGNSFDLLITKSMFEE